MLDVQITGDELHFGPSVTVRFMRTLRIPDDGREYPLPPGLGSFPIYRVEDYGDRVPEKWRERGGVFIPMYQREAMWIDFSGRWWKPNAVKMGVGGINVISGEPWNEWLSAEPQDYLVVPDQPWLDGINAGSGFIRQFVAMPLGRSCTVEGQLMGREENGGLQITVFEPKPGLFPDGPPLGQEESSFQDLCCCSAMSERGLGAGGRMRQKIYPDEYGVATWDPVNSGHIDVHLVNSLAFQEITGEEPPVTPVSAKAYTEAGLPWFELFDEDRGDVGPGSRLVGVEPGNEMEARHRRRVKIDDGLKVQTHQIIAARQPASNSAKKDQW